MYSIVLMMAMTSGADLPDLGHRHGCCGGYSSCSGSYSSCSGYSSACGCATVVAPSCCGGYQASCCGGRHKLFGGHKHHNSCCGGYTSCCGGYTGYVGCNGGYVGCNGGYTGGESVIIEEKKVEEKKPEEIKKPVDVKKPEEIKKPEEKKPEVLVPSPATIIVSLPADANLTIDDAATTSTAAVRVFTSPTLPLGQEFHYTLKAEYLRDGKPVVISRDITVRAGEETRVTLEAGLAGVASR
jgi:uncharacterized protein (TIGR03000 family)